MRRISILGIVLGGIVALIMMFLLNTSIGLYVAVKLDIMHQKSQADAQAMMRHYILTTSIYYLAMCVAFLCSVFGGWVSAFTARQAEQINGALSAVFLASFHIWSSAHYHDAHGIGIQTLYLAAIVSGGWLGGRLRAGQTATTAPARLSAV